VHARVMHSTACTHKYQYYLALENQKASQCLSAIHAMCVTNSSHIIMTPAAGYFTDAHRNTGSSRESTNAGTGVRQPTRSEAGHRDVLEVLFVQLLVAGDRAELHSVLSDLLALLFAVEERGDLLERKRAVGALRLNNREVQPDELDADPRSVNCVVLVAEFRERDRVHCAPSAHGQRAGKELRTVLVEHKRRVHALGRDEKALGAQVERQNLDGVRGEERRHRDVI
jgi:hypothetical protein